MCAAGSLKVNGFGYPTLILKIVSCLLAGLWLIINATDNKAHDYPLIRKKYWLLLFITPFLITETVSQRMYLLSLKPDIITPCCAVIFSTDANTVMSDILAMPLLLSQTRFFLSAPITIVLGLHVYIREKGAGLFSIASLTHFIISITALISFISIYFYELPPTPLPILYSASGVWICWVCYVFSYSFKCSLWNGGQWHQSF